MTRFEITIFFFKALLLQPYYLFRHLLTADFDYFTELHSLNSLLISDIIYFLEMFCDYFSQPKLKQTTIFFLLPVTRGLPLVGPDSLLSEIYNLQINVETVNRLISNISAILVQLHSSSRSCLIKFVCSTMRHCRMTGSNADDNKWEVIDECTAF